MAPYVNVYVAMAKYTTARYAISIEDSVLMKRDVACVYDNQLNVTLYKTQRNSSIKASRRNPRRFFNNGVFRI